MADLGQLKNFYGKGTLLYQQNLTSKLFNEIPTSDETIGGNGRFKATYFSGNEAGGAINPGEALATADEDDVLQPYITPKLNHWPIEITGREIRQSILAPADALHRNYIRISIPDRKLRPRLQLRIQFYYVSPLTPRKLQRQ